MAHLGQRDRKDPQNPVFVRYITNNKDWEKLEGRAVVKKDEKVRL